MKLAALTAVLAAVATPLTCGGGTEPGDQFDDPGLRTDRSAYVLERTSSGWETAIPYTFANRTGATVYLTNCRGGFALRLEKWEDGEWTPAWSPVQLMCLSPHIEIAPGETFEHTLRVHAAFPGSDSHPQLEVDEPDGIYRIVWLAGTHDPQGGEPGGTLIDPRFRTSNTFTLQER